MTEEPRGTIYTLHAGERPNETIEYGAGKPSDYDQACEYWDSRVKRGFQGKVRVPVVPGALTPTVKESAKLPRDATEGWLTEPEPKGAAFSSHADPGDEQPAERASGPGRPGVSRPLDAQGRYLGKQPRP